MADEEEKEFDIDLSDDPNSKWMHQMREKKKEYEPEPDPLEDE